MKSRTRKQKPALDEGLGERLKMTEWRKHYVSTVTAEEEAWPQREPGSNLGRIFVLLLLLHVFIIGAVVLYNIISPKAPLVVRTDPKPVITGTMAAASLVNADSTGTSTPASTSAPKTNNMVVKPVASTPAPEPVKSKPAPAAAPKPADDGLLTYEVKSGDNVPAIAATLGVNPEDLVKMNDLANTDLYPGRKLEYRKSGSSPAPVVAVSSAPMIKPQTTSLSNNHNLVVSPAPVAAANPKPSKPVVLKADKQNPNSVPMAVKIEDSASDRSEDSVPHAIHIKSMPHTEDQLPAAKPKVKSNSEDSLPTAKPKTEAKRKDKDRDKSDETKAKKSKADKDRDRDEPITKSKSDKSSKDSPHKRTHIVAPHETIYSISRKFGVSVSSLEKANNIKDPTHIRDGSKIIIPSKANAE